MQNVQTSQPETPGVSPADQTIAADFDNWLARRRQQFEDGLLNHLKELESSLGSHSRLPEAVLYSLQVGGKRLRPILVLEAGGVCGGTSGCAMPAAIAIELVHTFSLIHDDLPAMDDDDLRRGQPTNHKVFGEALAVLAGDFLATHPYTLLTAGKMDRTIAALLVYTLATGTQAMIEGQGADIEGEQRPTDGDLVNYIHHNKTAALIETSCRLGAICAGATDDRQTALARYGRHLGLAFQITDDLLDHTSTTEKMGKAVHKDDAAAKQTYPAAFGLDASRAQARREVDAALGALTSFGGRAERLRDLARYVLRRDR